MQGRSRREQQRRSPGSWILHPALPVLSIAWLCASLAFAAETRSGVLVLAHGGSPAWNASVQETVTSARLPYPTAVAFGMGMSAQEVSAMQEAVSQLQTQGATELLVVPLLVSSHSDVYRQYQYLLGLRSKPAGPHHDATPLTLELPVRLAPPLDDHPVVAEILLDRARALSQSPQDEVVVLVAHGPNSERDNAAWLDAMQVMARRLQSDGGFARVEMATLRDDASWWVRRRATQALRRLVAQASREHRVLVVPVLIARGGIEHKIPARLRGLSYAFSGEALLPHPRAAAWLEQTVADLVPQPTQSEPVEVAPGT